MKKDKRKYGVIQEVKEKGAGIVDEKGNIYKKPFKHLTIED